MVAGGNDRCYGDTGGGCHWGNGRDRGRRGANGGREAGDGGRRGFQWPWRQRLDLDPDRSDHL